MSKMLRLTFLTHAIIAAVPGLLLLTIPGRFLLALGWAPIDPVLSRVLGAAFLALAWSSIQGWRASGWSDVRRLVELELAFTTLASIGLLRHLLFARWPLVVWLLFAVFASYAAAWLAALLRKR